MAQAGRASVFLIALNRVLLGLYFLGAGLAKVQGELNDGIGSFYNGPFKGMQPSWLPNVLAAPYGYALPWAEVVVGALLAIGLFTKVNAALTFLMTLSFTIALMMANGLSGGGPGVFHTNVFLCVIAAHILVVGGGPLSVDATFMGRAAKRATGG
ncbi:MAG: DoxX family protein [Phycisphaeraceae bacterium]